MPDASESSTAETPKRTGPSWKKKLLALALATCLTLLARELTLRLFCHNSYAGAAAELVETIGVERANRD